MYLKLQPYQQGTAVSCKNLKLSRRYNGFFQIRKKVGQVAYKLTLPISSKIHLVFHVLQQLRGVGEDHELRGSEEAICSCRIHSDKMEIELLWKFSSSGRRIAENWQHGKVIMTSKRDFQTLDFEGNVKLGWFVTVE